MVLVQSQGAHFDDSHRPHSAGELLERLDGLLTPRTRLVALSHVTTETGVRLPALAPRCVAG